MPTKSVNNHKENLQIGTFFFNLERLYYSGSLIRFIELSKRIRKLLIFYVDGRVYKHLFPKNVAFIRVKAPTKIPRIFRCIYLMLKSVWLANKIKKLRVDALYILSGFWEQNIFALTSKIAHVPLIIRLRGDDWLARRLNKHTVLFLPIMKFYDIIETFALNQADNIIAINEFLAKKALAYGVRKEKISVVYHGIDSHLFKPEKARKRYKFTICCPGRLVRGKGIEDLLEAVRGLDLHVIVIGDGDKSYVEKIKKLAPNNVKFLGPVLHQKMPKYINYADIVVSPQHFMGWGRVVLEAMSCGKPVIVTISEKNYAKLGFKGWRVDPGDIKGLRKAIIEASQASKETLEKMGRENRKKIIEKFSWDIAYEKILTIIKKSIERSKIN